MAIRVSLNHKTAYRYDRPVTLGPQLIRLRPAPHCRTPVPGYSLKVTPEPHFVHWQQDPHGNYVARYVFPEPTRAFTIEVDLIADMTVINPFDFFVEDWADKYPFAYESWQAIELQPFLVRGETGPALDKFVASIDRTPMNTVDFLVALNQRLEQEIAYLIRMEPGVQSPEETLSKKSGSCRDSAWLMVQVLRHLGLAARFVSGYLIQLMPDQKPLDGPEGPVEDFTDLHAWTEVYLPGAGWVGLDPTSGLMAGEGHIPVASTPDPGSAAPIAGGLSEAETEFEFSMLVTRIVEEPRVTKPYTDEQWTAIEQLGHHIDQRLIENDVRLTMGGEPTFVSIDDMDGEEWNSAAVGPEKFKLSEILIRRIRDRFAPGGLLHFGQGKWYPGETLPRWAMGCFWRTDGHPVWRRADLIASGDKDYGFGPEEAQRFTVHLGNVLDVKTHWVTPAFEDVYHYLWKEQRLPVNVDPRDPKLKDPEERARLTRIYNDGLGRPTGYVMPLQRQWWQGIRKWMSGPWPVRAERMFLLPGDSPLGLRLPLDALPWAPPSAMPPIIPRDPFDPREPLPEFRHDPRQPTVAGRPDALAAQGLSEQAEPRESSPDDEVNPEAGDIVRTALCVEPREGRLHIFVPPVETVEDYLDLIAAIEQTAADLSMPVVVEGYLPPHDPRLSNFKVTPDPGVIEVNTPPSRSWDELVGLTLGLYEEARQTRLGTEKFDLDGTHTGTGGGNHVVLGGATPEDSPFLRRPDLLKSFLGYWNNHPSLSYLFSGRFIGPTSQAPRVDEGRRDSLYELGIAFEQVPPAGQECPPWLVDRIFRNLLVDLTGNTHRAEFCIDKLFSPDSSTGRLGLVELRALEMPPHAQMSLAQQLFLRALVAHFWTKPYEAELIDWGTTLHDRFLLPYFVSQDFTSVINDMRRGGTPFEREWFAPHFEFRFPPIGAVTYDGVRIELRNAIEPWYVLGEEPGGGGTVRFVDSSVERIEVRVSGMTKARHAITVNGRRVPLRPTGVEGEFVAGVRFRAWQPARCLQPTIGVHTPLVFDLVDTWIGHSLGGCTYHVSHPGGRSYETFPVNGNEAEARRAVRFQTFGHTPGSNRVVDEPPNPKFPHTLDLRTPVR